MITLLEFARQAKITKGTLDNVRFGVGEPRHDTLEGIGAVLGVPVAELHKLNAGQPEGTLRFLDWLRRSKGPPFWIAVTGAITVGLLTFLWYPLNVLDRGLAHLGQALVIALLFVALPRLRKRSIADELPPLTIGVKCAESFRFRWKLALTCWCFLYALLAAKALSSRSESAFDVALNALQNLGTVALLSGWAVLARRTVDAATEGPRSFRTRWAIVVVGAFAILETVFRFALAYDPSPPSVDYFYVFSGLGQGAVLALLCGRIGSQYIGESSFSLSLLSFYPVIQPLWPFLDGDEVLGAVLTWIALVLKCLLYLLLAWLIESEVLVYYLVRLRILNREIREGDRYLFLVNYQMGNRTLLERMVRDNTTQGADEGRAEELPHNA